MGSVSLGGIRKTLCCQMNWRSISLLAAKCRDWLIPAKRTILYILFKNFIIRESNTFINAFSITLDKVCTLKWNGTRKPKLAQYWIQCERQIYTSWSPFSKFGLKLRFLLIFLFFFFYDFMGLVHDSISN